MKPLSLELSDAGILAAGGQPAQLLAIDGQQRQSPGVALMHKKRLLTGRAAADMAHLYPRQAASTFWDRLNTQPLEQPGFRGQNQAEIACAHLAAIWRQIKNHSDETILVVPGFYDRHQLGILLGIAEELAIPVRGLVALGVAAAPHPFPESLLLHLDIHLHRLEVCCLEQGERLVQQDCVAATGKALDYLYKQWGDAVAREFVRTTRFDPYHRAESEQQLYNQLPGLLAQLKHQATIPFEMAAGGQTYSVNLSRNLLIDKAKPVFARLRAQIGQLRQRHGKNRTAVTLQVTHRLGELPGCREELAKIKDATFVQLLPGAGALGALHIRDQLEHGRPGQGIPYTTRRVWLMARRRSGRPGTGRPTHLLYRSLAYPIGEKPLFIGSDATGNGIAIRDPAVGVVGRHCALQVWGQDVVLEDYTGTATFVDEVRVAKRTVLQIGQTIRVGNPGAKLQLIACLENHET